MASEHGPTRNHLIAILFSYLQLLCMSSNYNKRKDKIEFSNNLFLSCERLKVGAFGDYSTSLFTFAKYMNKLQTDRTEYAILCAICLTSRKCLSAIIGHC